EEKWRNFLDANSNSQKCGSPHEINNRESQQGLPLWAMGGGFHGGFLPATCQRMARPVPCLLVAGLGVEVEPDEFRRLGYPGMHYRRSFPTGRPQSLSA